MDLREVRRPGNHVAVFNMTWDKDCSLNHMEYGNLISKTCDMRHWHFLYSTCDTGTPSIQGPLHSTALCDWFVDWDWVVSLQMENLFHCIMPFLISMIYTHPVIFNIHAPSPPTSNLYCNHSPKRPRCMSNQIFVAGSGSPEAASWPLKQHVRLRLQWIDEPGATGAA